MRSSLAALVVAPLLLTACAHKAPPPLQFDTDWIRPRLEERAARALRCLRGEPERVLEMAAAPDGSARALVHPLPANPGLQACADDEAKHLHVGPSAHGERVLFTQQGALIDPASPRARALTLRSRAFERVGDIDRCRQALLSKKPRAEGRVGVLIEVDSVGAIVRAEVPASSLDAETNACVAAAVRTVRLAPGMAGTYRYSYLIAPRGVLIGAPDVDPVDPYDLALATAALRPVIDPCLSGYRTAGRVVVTYKLANDGLPMKVSVDRAVLGGVERPEDGDADACLQKAARALRVLPFDGPPVERAIPFTLR